MSRANTDTNGDPIAVPARFEVASSIEGVTQANWEASIQARADRLGDTICKDWQVGINSNGGVYLRVNSREPVTLHSPEEDGPATSSVMRRACELAYALGKNDGVGDCVRETNRIMQQEAAQLLELQEPSGAF